MAREELLKATDKEIREALEHADPILLRGLLYQLTGDEAVAAIPHAFVIEDFRGKFAGIVDPEHVAFLRQKAFEFLKSYQKAGAGELPFAPERLKRSMELTLGSKIPDSEYEMWVEQMAIDPMARSFDWRSEPSEEQKKDFLVAVIGAGMGGLNAAMQLKRSGIPFVVLEKNAAVGGTWHENRYPGARVDTPSRNYFHAFAVNYPCPGAFCPQQVNETYLNWIADHYGLRDNIEFSTEVKSAVWDEAAKHWVVSAVGPDGERSWRANAVIGCVGFLNRPNTPEFEGEGSFKGEIFHTARWPKNPDLAGKRVGVIGSGATGYQMVPELVKQVGHLTLFQRTPSWCFEVPGYLSPFAPQMTWLDRNVPLMVNFARLWISWFTNPELLLNLVEVEPGFQHSHAVSPSNKQVFDQALAFIQRKLPGRPDLVEKMLPEAPPFSSRPVLVDSQNNIYDALMRENVDLVSDPIAAITPNGIRTENGAEHPLDVLIYATGFKANDFLWPMDVRGRGGRSIGELWAKDGARAYLGTMMPGFPNFFVIYGPNMNPFFNGLGAIEMEELTTRFALKCIGELILQKRQAVDVTSDAYERFNAELDRREATKVYADYRVTNYYKNDFGRSAVNCPIDVRELWKWWRDPSGKERPAAAEHNPLVKPHFGADLLVD
jgi:4-hydroxyacetophenone monooxygenase